jgi:transcriptional regulator with XRE-family HTH domain
MGDTDREQTCVQRLTEVLDQLAKQGLSQQQVAGRAGIPPQNLSDIKNGRRAMTELIARRVADVAGVSFEWLCGHAAKQAPSAAEHGQYGTICSLPLFEHPVNGDPRRLPEWSGAVVEVSGVAAAKLSFSTWPYVLRYGAKDCRDRLKKGDLILVSQQINLDAAIQVVKFKGKMHLARPCGEDQWERVADGQTLSAPTEAAGHCLGVIWSLL